MSPTFDAWWLPGAPDDVPLETLRVGELECRYPRPTADLVDRAIRALRAAGQELARRPVGEIVDAVDAVATRLADPADPLRQEADRLLPAATGYSQEMTALILDRMAADWRADASRRLLRAEIGDAAALDGFTPLDALARPAGGRRVRAYGPTLAFHVFAGNVPGVAVTSIVRSLLVKAPTLGKLASGEPVLPVLFARALAARDPALGRALAVTYWPGGAETPEGRVLEEADLVVVYGGAGVADSYRERVPAHHRLIVHGPRFSAGLVGQEALDEPELPARVARAIATFDQHGCVSPHTVWVEDASGGADAFAEALARALERLEAELPRGRISAAEAATIQQERGAAEMRGHDEAVRVFSPAGTAWTVVLDGDPTFRPSCLNRFVRVHPVAALEDAVPLLAPVGRRLQSVAIAASHDRRLALAHDLARAGATRVTSFDRLPWPPPEWHHDGRGPLRELLRWVDLED